MFIFLFAMLRKLLFLNKSHLILIRNLAHAAKVSFIWINYNHFGVTFGCLSLPMFLSELLKHVLLCVSVKIIFLHEKSSVRGILWFWSHYFLSFLYLKYVLYRKTTTLVVHYGIALYEINLKSLQKLKKGKKERDQKSGKF